jgi:ribosomal-protein-alanine N-acetyltransferase
MNLNPFPELITERLQLRQMKLSDCAEVLDLRSDETLNQYISRPKSRQITDEDGSKAFIESINEKISRNEIVFWSITLKTSPKTIGTICLWNFNDADSTAEIGYDLGLSYQQKGIMNEALDGVIQYGFSDLKLAKIVAFTHGGNAPSRKLLIRNGFKLDAARTDEGNANNVIFELKNSLL